MYLIIFLSGKSFYLRDILIKIFLFHCQYYIKLSEIHASKSSKACNYHVVSNVNNEMKVT